MEGAVGTGDGEGRGVGVGAGFYAADDLSGDAELDGGVDDKLGGGGVNIDFHTGAHVEYFIHFGPIGSGFALNEVEERRNGQQVVFDHV